MKKLSIGLLFLLIFSVHIFCPFQTAQAATTQPLKITTTCPLPDGQLGILYNKKLNADDGALPLVWVITSGSLPPGISLDKNSGKIMGIPTSAGGYKFSFAVYDAKQNTDGPVKCSISITAPPTATPTVTPIPFNYEISAYWPTIILNVNNEALISSGRLWTRNRFDVTLLTGSTRSGTLSLTGLPPEMTYTCDVTTGSPTFASWCEMSVIDLNRIPAEGEYPITADMDIPGYPRSDSFILEVTGLYDLSLTSIKPVQVVYDADLHGVPTLVKGKVTAFKATVLSTYDSRVEVEFALNLPDADWDTNPPASGTTIPGVPPSWHYPSTWGPVTLEPGENEVILPYLEVADADLTFSENPDIPSLVHGSCNGNICGPDIRVMPRPRHTGLVSYSVTVNPSNTIGEINLANNSLSSSANAISTRPLHFYIVPFRSVGDECSPGSDYALRGTKNMLEYLLALFPIADSELTYSFAPFAHRESCGSEKGASCIYSDSWESRSDEYLGFQDRYGFLSEIADLALAEGYDFAIGVGCGCGGGASGVPNAFFSGDCSGASSHVFAHEFNHVVTGMSDIYSLDCIAEWDESYCEHADGSRKYFCYEDALYKREGFTGTNCWMESSGLVCLPDFVKECDQSCYCSIYEENWEFYPSCTSIGPCDATCCKTIAEHFCSDGTVYTQPDGRIIHPASAGFWVNRYTEISGNSAYIMDSFNTGEPVNYWMRLNNTVQHCTGEVFRDGYLWLLRNRFFLDSEDPEALLVSGELREDGAAVFNPFLRIITPTLDLIPGDGEGYAIILLDGTGKPLAENHFDPIFFETDPDGGEIPFFHLSYRVAWYEGTQRIELHDPSGKVLAMRDVSPNAPTIKITSPAAGRTVRISNPLKVSWTASDPDSDPLTYTISISMDDRETWQALSLKLTEPAYEIDVTSFEPDTKLWIKVRATDGVNTTEAALEQPILLSTEVTSLFTEINPFLLGGLLAVWVLGVISLVWGISRMVKGRRK